MVADVQRVGHGEVPGLEELLPGLDLIDLPPVRLEDGEPLIGRQGRQRLANREGLAPVARAQSGHPPRPGLAIDLL